jgi:hypothetical protein
MDRNLGGDHCCRLGRAFRNERTCNISNISGLAVRLLATFDYEPFQCGADLVGRILLQEVPSFHRDLALVFPGPAELLACAASEAAVMLTGTALMVDGGGTVC